MSYRRGRSYRRADRLYRSHEERPPRARPALMIGLLAVVLAAGMAAVIMPRVRTVLDASVSAAAPASLCRNSAAAGSATSASAPAVAGATSAGADSASAAPAPTATVTPAAAAPAGPRPRCRPPRPRPRPARPPRRPRRHHRRPRRPHPGPRRPPRRRRDGTGAGRECGLQDHRACAPAECQRAGHPVSAHRPGWPDAGGVRLHRSQLGEPRGFCAGDHPEPGHRSAVCIRAACHHARVQNQPPYQWCPSCR